MYALVDCNNFYASCERVFQPQLIGQPIVVLSNNDGCVIARSYEAKDLGIPMGAPEFEYRALIKKHGVHVFSSNYALYGDMSARVMKILEGFTPHVEVYSIDEAFLNFEGMTIPDYHAYGIQMRKRVQKWLSIPICVGFAPSKALAKIANKIAKKFPERTGGSYVIDSEAKRIKALKWTNIEDVWGIGFRLTKKMKARKILTAYDFTLPEHEAYIQKEMGVVGNRLRLELLGHSILELEEPKDKKHIAVTRSFEGRITHLTELKERVSTFAGICGEKLRKQHSHCQVVTVYLRKDKFHNPDDGRYNFYAQEALPFPTNSSITLGKVATKMLEQLYRQGEEYKKTGVIVSAITPQQQKQYNLFQEENPKHEALMKVMDSYFKKTGERKIRLGMHDLNRTWKMKQNYLSPKFTTNIHDIITVQCR
jgi:DNA polymerase V